MTAVAGYDVGGAHLKVALTDSGRIVEVRQIPCPLWLGFRHLDQALIEAHDLTAKADRHAVTMTGELCEVFESRTAGVIAIVERLAARLGRDVQIYCGLKGLVAAAAARADPTSAASANFLATVEVVAKRQPQSLLIDFGSTTTDIIACDRPMGLTDAERLQTGELVYTGYTRTLVPAVASRAPLAGQWQGLARDGFANMADVRRVLGELAVDADQHPAVDGRGKSVADSLSRLARGFGRDADERHLPVWQVAASYIRECQIRSIENGMMQVCSRPGIDISAGIVAAGVGAPTAELIGRRHGMLSLNFGALCGAEGSEASIWATRCAPAVAVALLASD